MDKKWDDRIEELEKEKATYKRDWDLLAKPQNFVNRIAHSTFYVEKLKPSHDPVNKDIGGFGTPFQKLPQDPIHPFRVITGYFLIFYMAFCCARMFYSNNFYDVSKPRRQTPNSISVSSAALP